MIYIRNVSNEASYDSSNRLLTTNCSHLPCDNLSLSLLFVTGRQIDFSWFILLNCLQMRICDECIMFSCLCLCSHIFPKASIQRRVKMRNGNNFVFLFLLAQQKIVERETFRHLMVQSRLYWHSQSISDEIRQKIASVQTFPLLFVFPWAAFHSEISFVPFEVLEARARLMRFKNC